MEKQSNEIILAVIGDTYNNRDTALRRLSELATHNNGRSRQMPIPGDFRHPTSKEAIDCIKYIFRSSQDLNSFRDSMGKLTEEVAKFGVTIEEPTLSMGRQATLK